MLTSDRKVLAQLRAENEALRKEVRFLRTHPKIARGLRGEKLVGLLVDGVRARQGSTYDVITKRDGVRLEVKWSSLLNVRDGRTKRWVWTKLYGESGRKKFDRMILVGEIDHRFARSYRDSKSPYVFFDVPFKEVLRLTTGGRYGRATMIHITTNPSVVVSRSALELFQRFQTTIDELERKYSLENGAKIKDKLLPMGSL